MNNFILSSDQVTVLNDIEDLFNSAYNGPYRFSHAFREQVLTGSPGTGKSFLTYKIMEKARKSRYQLVLAATTHAATKVLADFTAEKVWTLHKLLDLRVVNNYVEDTTHIEKVCSMNAPTIELIINIDRPALLIIDEASYIDKEVYSYVQRLLVEYSKIIILYIGDENQLPPVNSKKPYIFNMDKPTNVLTTNHRFDAHSQVAKITNQLKSNIQDESNFLIDIKNGSNVTIMDDQDFLDKLQELYTSKEYKADPYYVKTMAYTNKVVDNINKHVRSYYYSDPNYQIDERLIVNSALVRKKRTLANNGDIVTVLKNVPILLLGVPGQRLTLATSAGGIFTAIVTIAHQKKNVVRKRLVKDKKWKELYNFMESFIQLKDIYASTIHKAQGATYVNTILHLENLVECQDHTLLARLLLVSISRASEHVYVYGSVPENLIRQRK